MEHSALCWSHSPTAATCPLKALGGPSPSGGTWNSFGLGTPSTHEGLSPTGPPVREKDTIFWVGGRGQPPSHGCAST